MNILKGKKIDWTLFVIICVLFGIGLLLIASVTQFSAKKMIIQSFAFFLGVSFMLASTTIDYQILRRYEWQLYFVSIALLLLVYLPIIGKVQYSARSWIDLGFIDFQTSEASKVTFTLAYSSFLDRRKNELDDMYQILPAIAYPMPIIFLLYLQPDLGGILVFFFITIFCLFVSGLNKKFIIGGILIVLITVPIIYKFDLLADHQMQRLDAFLHPGDPSYEGNYQVYQSITAIGSGRLLGKGPFKGTLIPFGFLPVPESDFIFSMAGEEFGMIGMGTIIILFFFLLSRIYYISIRAKDFYGTIICTGFLGMFLYQVFQNIGMTIGIMPITGVTLPFVSYGGSSIMMGMIIMSVIMNVYSKSK